MIYSKMLISNLKRSVKTFIQNLRDESFESIMWFLNFIPKMFGFYILGEKLNVFFWIFNTSILFYMYIVGILMYQIKYANTVEAFVKNYVNILITVMMSNVTYWFLTRRSELKIVLKMVKRNNDLVSDTPEFRMKHDEMIKKLKHFVMAYLALNFTDDIIYQSQKVNPYRDFAIVNCPGLDIKNSLMSARICTGFLFVQEVLILVVISNYHQFFLFVVSHTAGMYDMLSVEISEVTKKQNDSVTYETVRKRVQNLIQRHAQILKTVRKIKELYSKPMGIDFAVNASTICLVSFVPMKELDKLIFVLLYCTAVFFMYCFVGQRLNTAAEKFTRFVYASDWVSLELPEQKMIHSMLRQAQQPVELLAANLIPANVYTFATTLQSIYKFVTVIKFREV